MDEEEEERDKASVGREGRGDPGGFEPCFSQLPRFTRCPPAPRAPALGPPLFSPPRTAPPRPTSKNWNPTPVPRPR